MTPRRFLITAAATAATAFSVVGAPSASADVTIGAGGVTAGGCNGLHCWYGAMTIDIQPVGTSGIAAVAWNCQGTGDPDAVSTSIVTCALADDVSTYNAPAVTVPGPFVATASSAFFAVGDTLLACIEGQSAFAENVLGSQVVGGSACAPVHITRLPLS